MERTRFHRGTRGASVVIMAVFLLVLMGMGALAIDLGMLQKARAEAQRAADAAALAGASAFLLDQTRAQESTLAVHRARVVADTNYMNGVKIDSVAELEVWVVYDSVKVRTRVRRESVPTWFARVFGKDAFPVGARAAAEADYASGANCVKPYAIPDRWLDGADLAINGGNGNNLHDGTEVWIWDEAALPDTYNPAHYAGDGTGTGLGSALRGPERDWGLQVVLMPGVGGPPPPPGIPCTGTQGNQCYVPSWWGFWGPQSVAGQRPLWQNCDQTVRSVGEQIATSQGAMQALRDAMVELINLDPDARWDPNTVDQETGKLGTVVGSTYANGWRQSPRVWTGVVVAPGDMQGTSGTGTIIVNNFMRFFVEGCQNSSGGGLVPCFPGPATRRVMGRFVGPATGVAAGPNPGTMVRMLRLVE